MATLYTRKNYSFHKNNAGSSRAIVFIHGVAAGAWCWGSMAEYFYLRGFNTHAIDLPCHGTRVGKDAIPSLGDYRNAVRRLIKSVSASHEEVYVVGHSMGGHLVQTIGPGIKVKGVILLAPAPCNGVEFNGIGVNTIISTMGRSFKDYTEKGGSYLRHHIAQFFTDQSDPIIDYWVSQRVFEPVGVLTRLRFAPPPLSLPQTKRVLIGIPTKDIVIAPKTMDGIALQISGTGLHVTKYEFPLSHMFIAERGWQQVADSIHRWIHEAPV